MKHFFFAFAVPALALAACGGSNKPPANAADTKASGEEADTATAGEGQASRRAEDSDEGEEGDEEAGESGGIPTECARKGQICELPKGFVHRLCQDVYPSVALVLFRGGTPWTRGYLTRKTEAWNAEGGASIAGWLQFDEEVILLRERKASTGGMQVSGAGGGYQAIRWNGACVTLSTGEVTLREPPSPKAAKVEYKFLDDSIQESLRESDEVTDVYRARRSECKGAMMGAVSKKCETLDKKLSEVIVEHVRSGGPVGTPDNVP